MANGDTEAKDLLELELDGGAHFGDLVGKVLGGIDGCGELAGCGKGSGQGEGSSEQANEPLDKPGPSNRGICLMRVSEARKASYFFASFLTSFLFLFSLT
jgi:hypothetical protein